MSFPESHPFQAGQKFSEVIAVGAQLIDDFARFSGDTNPIHCDTEVARVYGFSRRVAHGAILVSALSRLIGMRVPGTGAVWLGQTIEWKRPVFEGDLVTLTVTIDSYSQGARSLSLSVAASNQRGETVMTGNSTVRLADRVAPKEKNMNEPRVALVTGGSRGIGAEVVRQLVAAGFTVVINYRSDETAAQAVVSEALAASGDAWAMKADIADPSAAAELVRQIELRCGRLDVVVHGASPALTIRPVEELDYADLQPYLTTYLGGALALVRAASPGMKARQVGRLIFIGTAALQGSPPVGMAAYLAAKHALWGLVRAFAVELGPAGVTSNLVSPELTVTDLTSHVPLRTKEVQARRNPMRRLPTPADTAAAVTFLASSAAGYVNGQDFQVTGGPA